MSEYIDNKAYEELCVEHPGLLEYVEDIIIAREQVAYREGYRDGYNDGGSLPQPPYYNDDDEFVFADGGVY